MSPACREGLRALLALSGEMRGDVRFLGLVLPVLDFGASVLV